MAKKDFSQYKPRLREYLSSQGVDSSKSPIFCFDPAHKNTNTPAMILHDEYFKCQSCAVEGDIYDAVEILQNIQERKEQYAEIERLFSYATPSSKPAVKTTKAKTFQPDPIAVKKVTEYITHFNGRDQLVGQYLKSRRNTTEQVHATEQFFGWWPGYSQAEADLGKSTLFAAGIPGRNPQFDAYSWGPSGACAKLGIGFKLLYFEGKKSKKLASKGGRTFPFPGLPLAQEVILVEGEASAASMRYAGYPNTTATGGVNGITKANIGSILEYDKICIAFDGDAAGNDGARGSDKPGGRRRKGLIDHLANAGYTGKVYIAELPAGKDPDDLVQDGKIELLRSAISDAKSVKVEKREESPLPAQPTPSLVPPFLFLGYDESAYYFMPQNQNIPLRISRGNTSLKNHIEELAPFFWWYSSFNKKKNDTERMLDTTAALTWMREMSYKRGVYNPEKILGVGVHRDGDDLLLNTGSSLLVYRTGKEIPYGEYTGALLFSRSRHELHIPVKPWNPDERALFMKQLKTFSFERPLHRICVAGFIAVAPFASVLHRCPHIWITAQRGSGKTTLLDEIVGPGLGAHTLHIEGKTTEAGVRQSIRNDCRPVILDEFEANKPQELPVIESILGLARSAYGGREIVKGTVGHEAARFKTKMMFCFSSVKLYLSNAANSSRIAIVRMEAGDGRMSKLPNMDGIRRMMYNRLPELFDNIKLAKDMVEAEGFDARTGDTYAPLLAGYWMIVCDEPFGTGPEELVEFVAQSIKDIGHEDKEDDEDRIVNHILQHCVQLSPGVSKTVAEMLTEKDKMAPTSLRYDKELRRIGIRRHAKNIDGDLTEVIAIASSHSEIKSIMSNTAFSEYKDVLSRHPSFVKGGKNDRKFPLIRMAGKNERCILLDWDKIAEEFIGGDAVVVQDNAKDLTTGDRNVF